MEVISVDFDTLIRDEVNERGDWMITSTAKLENRADGVREMHFKSAQTTITSETDERASRYVACMKHVQR